MGTIDPTGAAGMLMDLRVFRALGVSGVAVVAAVSAQNSRKVYSVSPLPASVVRRQLEAVWEEGKPAAMCIGVLADVAATREIRLFLSRLARLPSIVIDPVLASSSGFRFSGVRERKELRKLFSLATIVTPNADEAAVLTGRRVRDADDAAAAALDLARSNCAALVTGGHLRENDAIDLFAHRGRLRRYRGRRYPTAMRGAGGILAAAIAASLASGVGVEKAVERARRFVRYALRHARATGFGKTIAEL